jgi:hypothetical protein
MCLCRVKRDHPVFETQGLNGVHKIRRMADRICHQESKRRASVTGCMEKAERDPEAIIVNIPQNVKRAMKADSEVSARTLRGASAAAIKIVKHRMTTDRQWLVKSA